MARRKSIRPRPEQELWYACQAVRHGRSAVHFHRVEHDPDQAENYFRQALAYDPRNPINLGNYAAFLATARNDPDAAEHYYKRAVAADPADPANLGSYAAFLSSVRGDRNRAGFALGAALVGIVLSVAWLVLFGLSVGAFRFVWQ